MTKRLLVGSWHLLVGKEKHTVYLHNKCQFDFQPQLFNQLVIYKLYFILSSPPCSMQLFRYTHYTIMLIIVVHLKHVSQLKLYGFLVFYLLKIIVLENVKFAFTATDHTFLYLGKTTLHRK